MLRITDQEVLLLALRRRTVSVEEPVRSDAYYEALIEELSRPLPSELQVLVRQNRAPEPVVFFEHTK